MGDVKNRVVVTGMGVVAPNATNATDFHEALLTGKSGLRLDEQLKELNFKCQISGTPQLTDEHVNNYFSPLQLRGLKASGLVYGVIAATDAFNDAGLIKAPAHKAHQDLGIIMGTGQSGGEKFREAIHLIDDKQTRRLGSTSVIQTMTSGISAWLAGELGAGNWVTSNSSACCTGTEALIMGHNHIASGQARQMIVGSTSDSGPYIWGGFDAMRVLSTRYNDDPTAASRPLSSDAAGFAPGSGAGALVLESLENALERNATIYCEILGGAVNSGGHRNNGSMTAPNGPAVQACIKKALHNANIKASDISTINGHLTATIKDGFEIANWAQALAIKDKKLPLLNTFKSTIGHCLAAAGSIELVGCVLQLKYQKIYGNANIIALHPEVLAVANQESFPLETVDAELEHIVKASFGFGDVNAVAVLKRFSLD